jgi:hypothetical protein
MEEIETWFTGIQINLAYYELEYQKLIEATTTIELILWKIKIDGYCNNNNLNMSGSDFRMQCCINCEANQVVEHVLSFLEVPLSSQ